MATLDKLKNLIGFGAVQQKCLVLGEDNHARGEGIPVRGNRLSIDKDRKAWYRLRNYYTEIKHLSKRQLLIIDEYDALPLNPYPQYSESELKRLTDKNLVADEALDESMGKVDVENQKRFASDMMSLAVVFVVFMIVVIGGAIAAGRLDMGQIMQNIGLAR